MQGLFDLTDQVAVVTGGARGIGEAIARGLSAHGATVVIADLDLDAGRKVAESLAGEHATAADAMKVDISMEDDVASCFESIRYGHGRIDILVNNAGHWIRPATLELDIDDWNRVIAVNLTGTLLCSRAAGATMIEQRSGKIINISSISGFLGFKERVAYAATKHGVIGLTKSLANEWAPYNVRVNAIAPGAHETTLTSEWRSKPGIQDDVFLRNIPMGRMGKPEELAGAAVYLASDASSYATGHTIVSDGGWLLE